MRSVDPTDGGISRAARPVARAATTLDSRRVAGVVGGALLAVAAFLPWTQAPFETARTAFGVDVGFPLGVILVACGVLGGGLALRGVGEKWRRGAAGVAAVATFLFVVLVDGGIDAARVGAVVAVAGAVVLAASAPVPHSSPRVRRSVSGDPQFEEVV